MSLGTLVQEIVSVGISCDGLLEGIPDCGELSSSDQAIVDACIAANGKNKTTTEGDALFALLNSAQQDAYTEVRDNAITSIWVEYLKQPEHEKLRILYEYKAGSKQDMIDDFEDNIESMFPLWSNT